MSLLQSAYCSQILKQIGMDMATTPSAPMVKNVQEMFLKLVTSETEDKEVIDRVLLEASDRELAVSEHLGATVYHVFSKNSHLVCRKTDTGR